MNTKPITCWNQEFVSIQKLSEDRRCKITTAILRKRLKTGMEPEKACESGRIKPGPRKKPHPGKPTTCWGQEFPSQAAVTRDPRCVVSLGCFRLRLSRGWSPEKAATQPLDLVAARHG